MSRGRWHALPRNFISLGAIVRALSVMPRRLSYEMEHTQEAALACRKSVVVSTRT